MNQSEKNILASSINESARDWRGRVLHHVAVMDRDIGKIIARYFCTPEKENLFISDVVFKGFFGFRHKTNLLKTIINDMGLPIEKPKEFFKELNEIGEYRNKLAHATLDYSEQSLLRKPEDGISLVFYKNGEKQTELFDKKVRDDWDVRMCMVSSDLSTIRMVLGIKDEHR